MNNTIKIGILIIKVIGTLTITFLLYVFFRIMFLMISAEWFELSFKKKIFLFVPLLLFSLAASIIPYRIALSLLSGVKTRKIVLIILITLFLIKFLLTMNKFEIYEIICLIAMDIVAAFYVIMYGHNHMQKNKTN